LLGALARTWRVEIVGREIYDELAKGCIVAMWHGRMLLPMHSFQRSSLYVLVSMSGDGEVSQSLLRAFGYRVVRGSKSRGGARSLREMLEILHGGGIIVITPDGPRGPRHGMNPGLAWLAKATGYPILPVGLATNRAWRLRSWDRFTIPKPWAHVAVSFCEPVRVAREAGDADMESATTLVRERMLDAERDGFRRLNAEPDW
jgi:lysophospholipid acyltransferase (LPLAT)-like uncharacterized protein